jgi:hypothetical protein
MNSFKKRFSIFCKKTFQKICFIKKKKEKEEKRKIFFWKRIKNE